jgi:hypothetical protein
MLLRKSIFIALIFIAVVFAASSVYFYWQFSQLKTNPQKLVQEESLALIGKVSRLIVLPEGEMPTIATVSDPDKLKDQPFFAKAKVGDKVLIFPNSQKAILYNPTNDIIVEVAPVNIGQQ